MPRTTSRGSGSPAPTAWERTRLRCSARASAGSMRTLARLPKPVVRPYTGSPEATSRSTVARPRSMRARSGAPISDGAAPRATVSSTARVVTAIDATGHACERAGAGPLLVSSSMTSGPRPVRAPRGLELSCRGWLQEAALRMLKNNLDPDVAEDPANLVVYGGTGKAARTWDDFHAIVATLQRLGERRDAARPVRAPGGVFRTHEMAPRVLIANSNLVPDWADWDEFRRLEALGLTMYGQMTAGSWIYIGTQGIVQGTYETFAAIARAALRRVARRPAGGDRRLRRHGRRAAARRRDAGRRLPDRRRRPAPPRAPRRDALPRPGRARPRHRAARGRGGERPARAARSASSMTPPSCTRQLRARGVVPDIVTDQTAAHDPLVRLRAGRPHARRRRPSCASRIPRRYIERARAAMARQVRDDGRVAGARRGGRRLRQQPAHRGEDGRLRAGVRLPGLRAGLRAAAVLPRHRAVPLGGAVGQPGRHRRHRRARCASCFPRT